MRYKIDYKKLSGRLLPRGFIVIKMDFNESNAEIPVIGVWSKKQAREAINKINVYSDYCFSSDLEKVLEQIEESEHIPESTDREKEEMRRRYEKAVEDIVYKEPIEKMVSNFLKHIHEFGSENK